MNVDYAPFCFMSLNSHSKWIFFYVMFLYGFMWDCGDMFSGGVGITIDFTLMILFFTSICIEGRSVL